ncbi:GGDEF domain-containing protein [Undibacterium sp.]|uniref:GGDEF domain-containing protein n=1 Tax=Undibacterium sp. TaxID=1914977 RepID=UPI00374C9772
MIAEKTQQTANTARGSSLAGKAYWAMVRRVALSAAIIDVGYIILFSILGSVPLTLVNFVSIALYAGAYVLIGRKRNVAALGLIWFEVMAHAAFGSLLIGWDSGFHYYLLLFIPAIVIANTRGYAVPMVVALLAYYLGLKSLCDHLGPLAPLPGKGIEVVLWIHIVLVFGMFASIAAFYRKTIVIAELRLFKQATSDALTGLHNRSRFHTLSSHELLRSQRSREPVTVLLCDVDHFKRVNDQYGHEAGDKVLVHVTKILSANLRECDVLARWGGEEFLALMPNCQLDTAATVAERIRAAIESASLELGDVSIKVTVSQGVSEVKSSDDLQAAIARADAALYRSKNAGRNQVCAA